MDKDRVAGSWDMVPASPLSRLAAFMIDLVIVVGSSYLILRLLLLLFTPLFVILPHNDITFMIIMFAVTSIWALLGLGYFVFLEASPDQATLGKQCLGIQVITVDGGWVTPRQAILRNGLKFLTLIPWGLGGLVMLLSRRRRTAYDWMAGTLVVRSEWWMAMNPEIRTGPVTLTTKTPAKTPLDL
jgi:uncharacterized RDD family membrane protein YckC